MTLGKLVHLVIYDSGYAPIAGAAAIGGAAPAAPPVSPARPAVREGASHTHTFTH